MAHGIPPSPPNPIKARLDEAIACLNPEQAAVAREAIAVLGYDGAARVFCAGTCAPPPKRDRWAEDLKALLGPAPSPARLARVLGIGSTTASRWIAKGFIRTSRPAGGRTFVDPESVIAFLDPDRRKRKRKRRAKKAKTAKGGAK